MKKFLAITILVFTLVGCYPNNGVIICTEDDWCWDCKADGNNICGANN